jgi:hypothetical protein
MQPAAAYVGLEPSIDVAEEGRCNEMDRPVSAILGSLQRTVNAYFALHRQCTILAWKGQMA